MTTAQLSAALVAKGPVTVALTTLHDPHVFYKTHAGLYGCTATSATVSFGRPSRLCPASPVTLKRFVRPGARCLTWTRTSKPSWDATTSSRKLEVCWIVAEMIAKQKNGEAGDLDNTGYANLFLHPFLGRGRRLGRR